MNRSKPDVILPVYGGSMKGLLARSENFPLFGLMGDTLPSDACYQPFTSFKALQRSVDMLPKITFTPQLREKTARYLSGFRDETGCLYTQEVMRLVGPKAAEILRNTSYTSRAPRTDWTLSYVRCLSRGCDIHSYEIIAYSAMGDRARLQCRDCGHISYTE